jgi:hypothetical protein
MQESDVFAGKSEEKKTLELSENQEEAIATPSNHGVQQPISQIPIEERTETTPKVTDTPISEIKTESKPASERTDKKEGSENNDLDITLTIGASGSSQLEAIKQRIKAEEKVKLAAQGNLSLENIQESWDRYVNEHTSNSFQAAMKNVLLELEGKSLKATVPSPVAHGFITQESQLMEQIRNEFGTPDLTLHIEIDKSKFSDLEEEEVVKTYFTRNEALQELTKKNPMLLEMMRRLDLKPDDNQH